LLPASDRRGHTSEPTANRAKRIADRGTDEPPVVSLVFTGPSDDIKSIIESSGADGASLLHIDFWNWEG
jgi:hypothetical protein